MRKFKKNNLQIQSKLKRSKSDQERGLSGVTLTEKFSHSYFNVLGLSTRNVSSSEVVARRCSVKTLKAASLFNKAACLRLFFKMSRLHST